MPDRRAPALPAASLVVLRDSPAGPEVYMIRRARGNRFLANAEVFPGGKVDPADRDPATLGRCAGVSAAQAAATLGLEDGAAALAHMVAALRETFEEAGLLVARPAREGGSMPKQERLSALRRAHGAGELSFGALLTAEDLVLELGALRYLAHWITPVTEPLRFDARFFAVRAPSGQVAAHDPVECSRGGWRTVAGALSAHEDGEVSLAPPTLVMLEDLRPLGSVEAALDAAPHAPVVPALPVALVEGVEVPVLLLPGDHRYPGAEGEAGEEHFAWLHGQRWVRVRNHSKL